MLVIKPVQDKNYQKKLVEDCKGKFDAASLAYAAYDCEDDSETIRFCIGACQFAFHNGEGCINLLRTMPTVSDDEALMIMARAAMHFMFRCGIRDLVIKNDAADPSVAEALNFRLNDAGLYAIDLQKFYIAPCKYEANENK